MAIVVSSVPEARFQKFNVSWPEGWEVRYIPAPYTDEQVIEAAKDADYLLIGSVDVLSEKAIRALPNLKLIHTEGVSFDKVSIDAAAELGIPVCNNRAVNKEAVGEHCVTMMLAGVKRVAYLDRSIREKGYAATNTEFVAAGLHEIGGMTVGMIGMGAIGKEVVARLSGWNTTMVYYDPFRMTPEQEKALNVEYKDLDELFAISDIISIHVPVLPSTINMINRESMQKMKNSVLIVNNSRGEIVNNDDLVWALENDIIGGAALDTIAPEPMPDDHVLLHMSPKAEAKLTMTTHIAGRTDEAFARMLVWAKENFLRVENGEKPINVTNGVK